MATNVSATDDEIIEINNQAYGAARLDLVTPIVMQIAGSEQNYGGSIRHESHKKIIYDMVQSFPESEIAAIFSASATEKKQANIIPKEFNYLRRAFLVEIIYSNLEPHVDRVNPRAKMLHELWKQYDWASYNGMFGNVGVVNNPNINSIAATAGATLAELITATNGMISNLKAIGFNKNNMSQLTIGITKTVDNRLTNVGANREQSDRQLFEQAFEGASVIELPDYLDGTTERPRIEVYLRPLIAHHHATAPSVLKNYAALDGLSDHDIFSFETSAIEIEEKGAVQSQLLT